ncbi:hypothetical protein ACHAWF_014486 [Thalassiosira exigua]
MASQDLRDVVGRISRACETVGFFAVTNHGVDPDVVAAAWDASRDFFDSDPSVKAPVPMSDGYPYGYEAHESLGTKLGGSGDAKETFAIGPLDPARSGMPARRFPPGAQADFAPALEAYFNAMERLACALFRGLALALQLDDASWFLTGGRFDGGHQCALRLLNYPMLECRATEGAEEEVRIRAGAHTDYGAMTILKSGGPGLQLRLPSDATNGRACSDNSPSWVDVPHLSDAFIINLGDLMQRWTNDRWKSTLHRVIAVADGDISGHCGRKPGLFQSSRRQSIAFFVNMNGSASIVPLDSCVSSDRPSRYDVIKASDYLIERHAQSMGNSSKGT